MLDSIRGPFAWGPENPEQCDLPHGRSRGMPIHCVELLYQRVTAPHTTPNPAMTSPSPPSARLFRDEALAAQRTQLLGRIVLTPRISMFWLSAIAALLALAVIAFLLLGSHTRRVTVSGQLLPAGGLIRVHTPQAGVVLEKKVVDGQQVRKGDLLYVLTSDRAGEGARELQADIARQVGSRKGSLEQEIDRSRQVQDGELASLQRRADTLRAETAAIAAQIEQQKTRLSIAEDVRKRYQGLADQDYIARPRNAACWPAAPSRPESRS